jgi:hypothetical protein
MKTLKQHINEELKDYDRGIVDMLKFFAKSASGYQQYLFDKKAKDADSVDIVPLSEVFTPEEIKEIKKRVHPQPKMCYENAWKLMDRFYYEGKHEILYCEGYLNFKGLPIEHAFNKVDGKYVDCTVELALGNDVKDDTYVVIGEFDEDTVREILLENGFYGNIYDSIELKKFKELSKKDVA